MNKLVKLICVRGKEVFSLALWSHNTQQALKRAQRMLDGGGWAVYPA